MLEPENYVRMIFQDVVNRSEDDQDLLMSLMMGMCISYMGNKLGPTGARSTINKAIDFLVEPVQ
jgi:hypothetical protein